MNLFLENPVSTIPIESCDAFDGHFTDLKNAKISCLLDNQCISVIDKGCDGEQPFHSCRRMKIGEEETIVNCPNSTFKREGKSNIFLLAYDHFHSDAIERQA